MRAVKACFLFSSFYSEKKHVVLSQISQFMILFLLLASIKSCLALIHISRPQRYYLAYHLINIQSFFINQFSRIWSSNEAVALDSLLLLQVMLISKTSAMIGKRYKMARGPAQKGPETSVIGIVWALEHSVYSLDWSKKQKPKKWIDRTMPLATDMKSEQGN